MNFKLFLEKAIQFPSQYEKYLSAQEIQKFKNLTAKIDHAYATNNYKIAEKLEQQLEELIELLDNRIEELDQGGEEEGLDSDWSVQEDFAKIYSKYIQGKINKEELVEILRNAILDAPNIGLSKPMWNGKIIKSSEDLNFIDDKSIIDMAKDAYENKVSLINRIKNK